VGLVYRNRVGQAPLSYIPLKSVNTTAASSIEDMYANVKRSVKAEYHRFHDLPEFRVLKGHNKPISIVGGGPSLKKPEVQKELKEMAKRGPLLAAGSSHDWLIKFGLYPEYTAVCDADPVTALYLKEKNTNPNAKYLLASCVHEDTYNLVPREQVYMWHCHSDEVLERMKEDKLEEIYQGVGGGCTVGLRAISLCMMLGYSNIHFFGFDSCLSDEEHHAYGFEDETRETLGTIHKIRLGISQERGGTPGEKVYYCAGYQLAQASHFKEFYVAHSEMFIPTFHGEGLLKDQYDLIRKLEDEERAMV
jgi:hypothetical protein